MNYTALYLIFKYVLNLLGCSFLADNAISFKNAKTTKKHWKKGVKGLDAGNTRAGLERQ